MSVEERLMKDLKQAMKDKDVIKKNTIQLIRTAIFNARIEKPDLTEREIEDVIMSERKKREESKIQFEKVHRNDMIEEVNKEILCIETYLPQQFSDLELENAVNEIIKQENITDIKLLGYAIKKVKEKYGNRASGKRISDMVKKVLGGNI